ncbi:MAG TPA: glycosyltransferase [Clostridiales bacterium]|nr:glycosyltransferase [Clostridiales bacterium]
MREHAKSNENSDSEFFKQLLELGEECLQERKLNQALSFLKRANELKPNDPEVLLTLAKTYLALEKWSKAKSLGESYVKKHGNNPEIMQVLSKVYAFEGDYKKAISCLDKAARQSEDTKQITPEKENLKKLYHEDQSKKRILVLCAEGTDNFTDDIIKELKEHFWVRKKVVPKKKFMLVAGAVLAYRKGFLSSKSFQLAVDSLLHTYLRDTASLLNWADVTWIEWASELAVALTNLDKSSSKYVVRLHRYEAFEDYPYLIKWENVEKTIFVAEFMKEILNLTGVEIDKIRRSLVIYNGVDLNRFSLQKREPGFNIGWVAHINPRKNLALAVEIMSSLVRINKGYTLHVAGSFKDKEYEIYVKHLVERAGLEQNVKFYGWVEDIGEWWKDKQYLLSTSISESFGYNIVEAMAMGIKPVIHDFYNAKELFESKWLFRTVDEAVQIITSDDYDSAYYRSFVQQRYSLDKQVSEFIELFQELTSK